MDNIDDAKALIDKQTQFLEKRKIIHARYKIKNAENFQEKLRISQKKNYYKKKKLLEEANKIAGVVIDTPYVLPENDIDAENDINVENDIDVENDIVPLYVKLNKNIDAQALIDKQTQFLEKRKIIHARYKINNAENFQENLRISQKKNYYKKKKLLEEANKIAGVVIDTPYVLPENDIVVETDIVPLYVKLNKNKGVSSKKIPSYIKVIKNIHKKYTNNELDDDILKRVFDGSYTEEDELYIYNEFPYLLDIEPFIEFMSLVYVNTNTLKTYLMPYNVITSHIETYEKSYQILAKLNNVCTDVYNNERDKNIIDKPNNIISFNPVSINEIINNPVNFKDSKAKLIYGLYMLLDAPRRLEIRSLKLTNNQNINELNDYNYLIITDDVYTLVFNDYKTVKTFKKQSFTISKQLKDIIDVYCKDFNITIDDYLLQCKKGYISETVIAKLIKTTFNKIYNYPITNTDIRISASTYNHTLNKSIADNKIFASKMAHSYMIDLQYVKKIPKVLS
jgi:DNA-directed RNA polymerase subunit L